MITIEGLEFEVGGFRLWDINLHIRRGEYFVLLGKPGSGKTILLECLAGLQRIRRGHICIAGRRVEDVEPRGREIGYVPQDYALFATRTVRGNMEFGMRVRGVPAAQRQARVEELAQMLGIGHLLNRGVRGLSGGERQRVALARALAIRPKVLLLDEPVSALDGETRDTVLAELVRVQSETHTTIVHVCHDLDEMRSVADAVGVMDSGRLIQTGSPAEIQRSPANAYVARLFGLGTILQGMASPGGHGSIVAVGELGLSMEAACVGAVELLVRAADLRVGPAKGGEGELTARVRTITWRDASARVELDVSGQRLRADVPREQARVLEIHIDQELSLAIPREALQVVGTLEQER